MQQVISWLENSHNRLSDDLNLDRLDWDAPTETMTDEQLDEMGDYFARTTFAAYTTPLYETEL